MANLVLQVLNFVGITFMFCYNCVVLAIICFMRLAKEGFGMVVDWGAGLGKSYLGGQLGLELGDG